MQQFRIALGLTNDCLKELFSVLSTASGVGFFKNKAS
jgi:hypothetical protein